MISHPPRPSRSFALDDVSACHRCIHVLLASELLADLFPDEGGALHRLLIALLDRDEFLLTKFEALKLNS